MGNIGLNHERIIEIAADLDRQGREVTIQAVRHVLGTGSFTTISAGIKRWRAEKDKTLSAPPASETVEALFANVWNVAWTEAQKTIETEREALKTEREKWGREQAAMLFEIGRAEGEFQKSKQANAVLEQEREQYRSKALRLDESDRKAKETIAKLQAQNESLEERRKEASDRAERLERELASIAKTR